METITLACLVSSRSDGDNLESAVLVRVGQDQLGPGAVAVHHEVPNTPRLNLQTLRSAAAVNLEYD